MSLCTVTHSNCIAPPAAMSPLLPCSSTLWFHHFTSFGATLGNAPALTAAASPPASSRSVHPACPCTCTPLRQTKMACIEACFLVSHLRYEQAYLCTDTPVHSIRIDARLRCPCQHSSVRKSEVMMNCNVRMHARTVPLLRSFAAHALLSDASRYKLG